MHPAEPHLSRATQPLARRPDHRVWVECSQIVVQLPEGLACIEHHPRFCRAAIQRTDEFGHRIGRTGMGVGQAEPNQAHPPSAHQLPQLIDVEAPLRRQTQQPNARTRSGRQPPQQLVVGPELPRVGDDETAGRARTCRSHRLKQRHGGGSARVAQGDVAVLQPEQRRHPPTRHDQLVGHLGGGVVATDLGLTCQVADHPVDHPGVGVAAPQAVSSTSLSDEGVIANDTGQGPDNQMANASAPLARGKARCRSPSG